MAKRVMHVYDVYWAPEGRKIATVTASTAKAAKKKAPQPYRKYLGEIYVEDRGPVSGAKSNRRHGHNPSSLSGMVADVKQLPREVWTDAKVMVTKAGKIVAKIPAKAMKMTRGNRKRK